MFVTSIITHDCGTVHDEADLAAMYEYGESLIELTIPQGLQVSVAHSENGDYTVLVGGTLLPAVAMFMTEALDGAGFLNKLPIGTTYWVIYPKNQPRYDTPDMATEAVLTTLLTSPPENAVEAFYITAIGMVGSSETFRGIVDNFRVLKSYGLPTPYHRHFPTVESIDRSSSSLYNNEVHTLGYQSKRVFRKATL